MFIKSSSQLNSYYYSTERFRFLNSLPQNLKQFYYKLCKSSYQFRDVHSKSIRSRLVGSHYSQIANINKKSNLFLRNINNNDNSLLNPSFFHFLSTNYSLFNNNNNPSLQICHFSTTPRQFRVKIDVKPVDPKLELPTDPYVLSEWVQNLGNADKLDDAISVVWHSKKDAQSEVVWNNLIVECVKKKKVKMGFQLFIEVNYIFLIIQQLFKLFIIQ